MDPYFSTHFCPKTSFKTMLKITANKMHLIKIDHPLGPTASTLAKKNRGHELFANSAGHQPN